jgi:transposase
MIGITQIASMRATGASWQQIADRMGVGVGTACRALQQASKNPRNPARVSG